MTEIKAITFDIWDTLLIDDSDEPKRRERSMPSKPVERRDLVQGFIEKQASISREIIDQAYDAVDEAFKRSWEEQWVTWTVRERLLLLFDSLELALPQEQMAELVQMHEEMELRVRPDFINDIKPALESLHEKYRLGIISDTIFSPGRTLRRMLEDEGILRLFDSLVFSDEVGSSKPSPVVFTAACKELGVEPEQLVHVGDKDSKDVSGAHSVGAGAILCTASVDRSSGTAADAVFGDYRELAEVVEKLNG